MVIQKLSNERIDRDQLDHRGRTAVWDKGSKHWLWMFPIDARELVGSGHGEFNPEGEGVPPKPKATSKPGDVLRPAREEIEGTAVDSDAVKSRIPRQTQSGGVKRADS